MEINGMQFPRVIEPLEREGKLYEQRYQLSVEGKQDNRTEKQIDYGLVRVTSPQRSTPVSL
jgi:hypothetical protein